mgnify:CR=1 FL=1
MSPSFEPSTMQRASRSSSGRATPLFGLLRAPAEMRGEGGDRIVAAPVDQVLGEAPLLLGNGGVALELLAS